MSYDLAVARSENVTEELISNFGLPRVIDPFEQAGWIGSVAFAAFADWVVSRVEREQVDHTFALSREGPLIAATVKAFSGDHVDVLEVSRLSTLLASLPDFSVPSMMRMWERFPSQSPTSMLAGLGLSADELAEPLRRHDLDPNETIHEPWTDRRVLAFLDDGGFLQTAGVTRECRRSLLLSYLDEMGYRSCRSVALVDIGWRGSIQDALARLVPTTRSTGLLLALRPANLPQYENTTKSGFLAGVDDGGRLFGQELRLAANPLEMLCTAPGGSATSYAAQGGTVAVVRSPVADEEEILGSEIKRFQAAVVEGVDLVAERIKTHSPAERRLHASLALKAILFDPHPEIVEVFERYRLDPSIGGEGDSSMPSRGLLGLGGRQALKRSLQDHGWPHALLKRWTPAPAFTFARGVASRSGSPYGRWLV